jgi:general secretion pathway protein D
MIMQLRGRVMRCILSLFVFCMWSIISGGKGLAAQPPQGDSRSVAVPAAAVSDSDAAATRFVTIDFDEVDIAVFIKYISELTGRNFVVDKAVKGNVTIISPSKISAADAYAVFESVLEVEGFTTVPAGRITKIVPAVEARSKGVQTGLSDDSRAGTDKVVTQIIPLQYADAEELKNIFTPLVSKTSVVMSYTPTGMLIVTDVQSNIKRLQQIIKEIDVPALGEVLSVLPLQYASAADVAQALTVLFQPSATPRPVARGRRASAAAVASQPTEVKIIPDERTNSLIVLASDDDTAKIQRLLVQIDKDVPRGEGDIRVYYLQNGDAEEMSKVLTTLPSQQSSPEEKGKAPVISKDVQIVADKATNSLVITAKKGDYAVIEDVIKQLDIPRSMVYLEALIMEVNLDKNFSLGVQWQGGFVSSDDSFAGFGGYRPGPNVDSNLLPLLAVPPQFPHSLSLGVLGKTINIGGVEFPTIAAVLQAYKNDADVHIVSTPQILTTDNQEAEIKVGENVPYITSKNTTTGTLQDYTNYEYKDVGVTLKITPQINQEGLVRLDIYTEVIKLKNPDDTTQTPTTLKRTADTTVIVQDQNTVVIGGIIGDDTKENVYKVPLLGDIPILGYLFKTRSTSRERTNLYIFLTPRIINNAVDAAKIYQEKREDSDRHQSFGFSDIKKNEK